MLYLKINNHRYNLTDDGVNAEEAKLTLKFPSEETFLTIKDDFSNLKEIVIYGCIVQEDGRETDEYIAQYFDKTTKLQSINFDIVTEDEDKENE